MKDVYTPFNSSAGVPSVLSLRSMRECKTRQKENEKYRGNAQVSQLNKTKTKHLQLLLIANVRNNNIYKKKQLSLHLIFNAKQHKTTKN